MTDALNMRTPHQLTAQRRNLSRRLPKPAQGNGRVQRACRRALLVHGTASTSEVIAWAYARRLLIGGDGRRNDFNRAVRRALEAVGAVKVRRAATIGKPWIWAALGPLLGPTQ
jgi:hypothetical protein